MRDGRDDDPSRARTPRSRAAVLAELGQDAADAARARVPGASALFESLEREAAAGSGLLAGGIAYRFFLWLVPFGLLLAAIASFWLESDPDGLEQTARDFGIAGASARSASRAIAEGSQGKWYFLGVGLVLLVWFGMSAARALRVAHQIAWADASTKLANPLKASLAFCTVTTALVSATAAERWLDSHTGALGSVLSMLALLTAYAAVALGVMSALPHRDAPPRALLPGAIVVAVGMELIHLFVVLYLAPSLDERPELYGALGAATVFLLWLYVIARLIVSAAFLNATLWERQQRALG